jgi:cytidyltransferase-like protein
MISLVKHGIVHGRFQPPHNGHIQYILKALEQADHITIGICTPKICTEEEAQITGYPCTSELNPFTHNERASAIEDTLRDAGISSARYTIIPFPSDYKDIQSIIQNDKVFFISHSGDLDTRKKYFLEDLGYKTETILSVKDSRTESGQKIRDLIASGDPLWKSLVPEAVKNLIESKGN